jgi:hypothetical protein
LTLPGAVPSDQAEHPKRKKASRSAGQTYGLKNRDGMLAGGSAVANYPS